MVTGTVKFFNRVKSFGFIAGDDGKDYFVHVTGLKPGVAIDEGDKVSFEFYMDAEGLPQITRISAMAPEPKTGTAQPAGSKP